MAGVERVGGEVVFGVVAAVEDVSEVERSRFDEALFN